MKTAIAVVALAMLGCGAAATPPASTTSSPPPSSDAASAPDSSAAAGATAPATEATAALADAPTARVLGVAVSSKEDNFTRVTISFENKTGKVCRIASYTVRWSGGSKEFPLNDFSLGNGESKTRASRVHAGEGDITLLTDAESTQVDVNASCQ